MSSFLFHLIVLTVFGSCKALMSTRKICPKIPTTIPPSKATCDTNVYVWNLEALAHIPGGGHSINPYHNPYGPDQSCSSFQFYCRDDLSELFGDFYLVPKTVPSLVCSAIAIAHVGSSWQANIDLNPFRAECNTVEKWTNVELFVYEQNEYIFVYSCKVHEKDVSTEFGAWILVNVNSTVERKREVLKTGLELFDQIPGFRRDCTRRLLLSLLALEVTLLQTGLAQNRINRQRGNILKNLTLTHEYENHIVTSQLDASMPIRMFYRGFREVYNRLLGPTGDRVRGAFLQPHVMPNVPFPCETEGYRSERVPTSVHQLRPGDIDIISAVGDSLTSATAANSVALWELLIENRGLAWCIGGQGTWRTHLTLPNILKEFNPKLFGYSLFDSYNVHHSAQFNVAENIATTTDMPYNAAKLVARMKLDP
ncbi:hypothetical protein pipiens_018357, partial [Culex pipiens pipiens]